MVTFQRRQPSLTTAAAAAAAADKASLSGPSSSFFVPPRRRLINPKRDQRHQFWSAAAVLLVSERTSAIIAGRRNYSLSYSWYYFALTGILFAVVCVTFFIQMKQRLLLASTLPSLSKSSIAVAATANTSISLQKRQYPPGLPTGILSRKPAQYFYNLQETMDQMDPHERCRRYGWTYHNTDDDHNNNSPVIKNQIYFGSLLADEPWEILEIMAAETRGIFEGMVFVESDRTQSNAARQMKRVGTEFERLLSDMFQSRVIVRTFINHNSTLIGLERENWQRQSILLGWQELGMQPDDLGYVADTDETMTRDFLTAIRTCTNLPVTNYQHHQCNPRKGARLYAMARIWEGSPDCTYGQRSGHHPSIVVGHCIEGIADTTGQNNKVAPRENIHTRLPGYGKDCFFDTIDQKMSPAPLWNPADFRMILCGDQPMARMLLPKTNQQQLNNDDDVDLDPNYSRFTGYHLHNFFADFHAIRYKYQTYGHATDGTINQKHLREGAFSPLGKIHNDLGFLHTCFHHNNETTITEEEDGSTIIRPQVKGGFDALPMYFVPIYFRDAEYRAKRQQVMLEKILADDQSVVLAAQQQRQEEQKHHKIGKIIRVDLTK